jgi:hypothetical protein
MVLALAVKLVIDAGGTVCVEVEPPPQPASPARPAASVMTHVVSGRRRFILFFRTT